MPRNSTTYSIAGTKFLRLASYAILDRWGGNLQNIEKSMRAQYIPDDGLVFIQCDQSGADALFVAYLCRRGRYRELFENKIKPHTFVALHLFTDIWKKRAPRLNIEGFKNAAIKDLKFMEGFKEFEALCKASDDWAASERYYYLAKQTCHSGNYDAGVNAVQLGILKKSKGKIVASKQDVDRFLKIYNNELFPEIPEWRLRVRHEVERTKTLYTLQGYPITFTRQITDTSIKECYASVPQASVGVLTHIAYTKLQEEIENGLWRADLLANTHDSYMLQTKEEYVQDLGKRMMRGFSQEIYKSPVDGVEFSMRSEAQWGYNWGPQKKTNPNGLREIIFNN